MQLSIPEFLLVFASTLTGIKLDILTDVQSSLTNATSEPFYPSPWMSGQGEWADAYTKAKAFVGQLTLLEKVNLTTGVGWGVFSPFQF
jgi:hypothetical protein